MLDNCKSARERWGGVSIIIDRWLKERQDLLVLFCKLTAEEDADQIEQNLRSFCQILVDYISAGHFEVYEQLMNEGREYDDQDALNEAKNHFKSIDGTTEWILDFNDKYQETDDLATLKDDLSKLGESLAVRFEAEDAMIEVLHNSHRNQLV
jgi:regulator of sigma D